MLFGPVCRNGKEMCRTGIVRIVAKETVVKMPDTMNNNMHPILASELHDVISCEANPYVHASTWERFQEEYKEQINELFQSFLLDEAVKSLKVKYPGVLELAIIDDRVGLPGGLAGRLEFAGADTVEQFLKLSPEQLESIPGIGPYKAAMASERVSRLFESGKE